MGNRGGSNPSRGTILKYFDSLPNLRYFLIVQVTVHEVTEITRRLDVTVSAAEVREELDRVYTTIGRDAKLKGFRPGKIPRHILEQNFGPDATSEAVRNLVSHSYPEAVEATQISPVSSPQISIKQFKNGEDLVFEAVVEIKPMIKVTGYLSLTLTKQNITVSDPEVETGLKTLQERAAQLLPITEPRKSREKDIVIFDYEGFRDNKPVPEMRGQGQMAELGSGHLLPEFEKGLIGMEAQEKKRIKAGSDLEYEVTLKEMKEKKLPELNDDFARDLGNFTSLTEVKEKIRQQLELEKEQREKAALARQVIELLEQKNQVPVPEGMIQVELEAMFRQFESSLRAGVSLEQAGVTPEEFLEKNRAEAKFRVLGSLLLEAIAGQEGITVMPEEVDQRIEELAKQAGQSPEAWKRYYKEKNLMVGVEAALREEKTLDFVLSKATIKVGK